MKNGWVYSFLNGWKQTNPPDTCNIMGFCSNEVVYGHLRVIVGSFLKTFFHFKSPQDEVRLPQVYITDVPSHAPAKSARPA